MDHKQHSQASHWVTPGDWWGVCKGARRSIALAVPLEHCAGIQTLNSAWTILSVQGAAISYHGDMHLGFLTLPVPDFTAGYLLESTVSRVGLHQQCLNTGDDHVHSNLIEAAFRDDHVGIALAWFDELKVHGTNGPKVLADH